ncbi:MAG: hypothetical protein AB1Z98_04025 [Nannocystaceae bacterium]
MSQILVQTSTTLERVLDDIRRRLGLDEHDDAGLLGELAALASWVIGKAEAGHPIDAQEVLDRIETRDHQLLPTRVMLDDDDVNRLAEILDRGFSPTPALRGLLGSLADPDHVAPAVDWGDPRS